MAIRCAHCRDRHDTVAEVAECAGEMARREVEARSEAAAEAAAERYFEEGTEAQHAQYQWEVEMDEARAWNDPYITRG